MKTLLEHFAKSIKLLGSCIVVMIFTTCIATGQYPLLPIPTAYQSPSGETGQILLEGTVKKVSLFHGKNDDEADWHIYINLKNQDKKALLSHFKANNIVTKFVKLETIYSELMVLDQYRNLQFDEKFYSADVSKPFLLSMQGSSYPAWDLGVYATKNQGDNRDISEYSKLIGGRVYLQGPFVNDKEHNVPPMMNNSYMTRIEIHPLDGIAFALNKDGKIYSSKYGQPKWATSFVKWRVAFFANSGFHRINGESYLKKDRLTTFYLDLPKNAYANSNETKIEIDIKQEQQELWNGVEKTDYSGRGWKKIIPYSIEVDPKDGRKKLKVSAIMKKPDDYGGILVIDYEIRVSLNSDVGN